MDGQDDAVAQLVKGLEGTDPTFFHKAGELIGAIEQATLSEILTETNTTRLISYWPFHQDTDDLVAACRTSYQRDKKLPDLLAKMPPHIIRYHAKAILTGFQCDTLMTYTYGASRDFDQLVQLVGSVAPDVLATFAAALLKEIDDLHWSADELEWNPELKWPMLVGMLGALAQHHAAALVGCSDFLWATLSGEIWKLLLKWGVNSNEYCDQVDGLIRAVARNRAAWRTVLLCLERLQAPPIKKAHDVSVPTACWRAQTAVSFLDHLDARFSCQLACDRPVKVSVLPVLPKICACLVRDLMIPANIVFNELAPFDLKTHWAGHGIVIMEPPNQDDDSGSDDDDLDFGLFD
eukprot:m.104843 g.104843  ORF g.104843 m.104843 type:complete len:349 (-) comp12619_c0_seq4:788-1834(-)